MSPKTKRLSSFGPRPLGWDGAVHEDEEHFRWVIRHENQQDPEWCWAACVRNALSCFAVEVTLEEIAKELLALLPIGAGSNDKRIPLDKIVPLWWRLGFDRAEPVDKPIDEDSLKRELRTNGPVELDLWPDGDSAPHHLILVTGFRTANGSTHYGVSDPLAQAETWTHTYAQLIAPQARGRWKRTYCGLEYLGSALRRFVFSPAHYYATFDLMPPDPTKGSPPTPMFGESELQVQELFAPKFFRAELSSALSGYRHYMWRRGGAKEELSKTLWLGESLPMVSNRRKLDPQLALRDQWERERDEWSSIVYVDGRERYYVRSELRGDGEWYSRWIGEKWTRVLASSLRALARRSDLNEQVQVVRVRFRKAYGKLYLLRLVESDRYLVAHVRGHDRPLNELLNGADLADRLSRKSPEEFAEGLTEIDDSVWGVWGS
jgi:hypothetical protein